MKRDALDPRELILDAYRIEGIKVEDCRSIFLDWALGVPVEQNVQELIVQLLDRYRADNPDHPMTQVMQDGLQQSVRPQRRGGWRSRERE